MAGDMTILSPRQVSAPFSVQLLSAILHNFQPIVYYEIVICFGLIWTLMICFIYWDTTYKDENIQIERNTSKLFITNSKRSLWALYGVVVDQEDHNPIAVSNRILWFAIVASMFFAIFGVYLNLLSCDLVSQHQPSQIETLDEFLTNEKWADYEAYVLEESYFYNYMMTSAKGTSIQQLRDKTYSNGKSVLKPYLMSEMSVSDLMETADRLIAGYQSRKYKVVILFEKFGWDTIGWNMNCAYNHKTGINFFIPVETFASGLISAYYGKHVPEVLTRRYDYNIRIYAEGGFSYGMHSLSYFLNAYYLDQLNMKTDWNTIKCMEGIDDNDKEFVPLKWTSLHSLLIVISYAFVISSIILVVERILSVLKTAAKTRRQKLSKMFKRNPNLKQHAIVGNAKIVRMRFGIVLEKV